MNAQELQAVYEQYRAANEQAREASKLAAQIRKQLLQCFGRKTYLALPNNCKLARVKIQRKGYIVEPSTIEQIKLIKP